MRELQHPKVEDLKIVNVLYALGDPIRLSIVRCLATEGEQTCSNVRPDVSKSTASLHFRILREAGVIRMKPSGTAYLNSVRVDDLEARFPGLLDRVLAST